MFPGEVLVRDGRIEAVARGDERSTVTVSTSSTGKGATLMPGIVEAHVHLTWPSSVERIVNTMKLPPEEHLPVTAQNARVTLPITVSPAPIPPDSSVNGSSLHCAT